MNEEEGSDHRREPLLNGLKIALLVGALVASACDSDWFSGGASATCVEPGAQCLLPDGPQGVCEQVGCGPGASPPCFKCVPQH